VVGLDWPFSGAPKVPWRSEVLCTGTNVMGPQICIKRSTLTEVFPVPLELLSREETILGFPTAKRLRAFDAFQMRIVPRNLGF